MIGRLGALWGLLGVNLLLGSAVYRLSRMAVEAFSYDFSWRHWGTLIVFTLFMAFAEGYRGFQQRFSPRVAARVRYLVCKPSAVRSLLAPLFCMGYIHATRRRKVVSISLTLGIIVLIVLVRLLQQPWRGIVDVGVVVGLVWGIVSLLYFTIRAFTDRQFPFSPEVPEETPL